MSTSINRRDTLKLASAAAALGAGLGVVLRARDAIAGEPTPLVPGGQLQQKDAPSPAGQIQWKVEPATQLKIEGAQQLKIDTYQKLPAQKGQLQIKLSTASGQLLYASNVPEEIGQLLLAAPNGQLQIKLWKPVVQGANLAVEPFREGLMQFVPTNPGAVPAQKVVPLSPPPAKAIIK